MDLLLRFLPHLKDSGAHIKAISLDPSDNSQVYALSFNLVQADRQVVPKKEAETENGVDGEDLEEVDTESASDTAPFVNNFSLGHKGDNVTGALRLTRDKCYWLFAHQDTALPAPTDTQVLALHGSGHVAVILPLTTDTCMGTLRGPIFEHDNGLILARFERSNLAPDTGRVVIAIAKVITSAIKIAIKHARSLLYIPSPVLNGPTSRTYPFEDKLTYCTWNSLQPPTPTTAASALKTLEHFHSIGVRPAAFLIDDAWQDVKGFKLQQFTSSPSFLDKFTSLAEVVKMAKEKYRVEHVGVWHTIQGYWQGVEPNKFATKYKLVKVTKDGYPGPSEEKGFQYHIPHPDSVHDFFKDYYATLRAAGITFTKCDNMASIDHIISAVEVTFTKSGVEVPGDEVDIIVLRKAYVQAVMTAARDSFGAANVIWCMGMTPRVLLGDIGLGGKGEKRIVRNSDDYYPNEPDSHRYHIFTNTINALLLNELGVQPDLDMFQTHPYISPTGDITQSHTGLAQASFHASFRVFGTGPVTITDAPLKSDPTILRKIVGDLTPNPTSPSLVVQASTPFAVLNEVFDQRTMRPWAGKGLKLYVDKTIGIWNVQSENGKLIEFVTNWDIAQVLGLSPKSLPAVILHIQASNPAYERIVVHDLTNVLHPAPPVRIELDPLGWATVGVSTIDSVGIACLGLVDKYLSARGIEGTQVENDGMVYTATSRCSGTLGLWVSPNVSLKGGEVCLLGESGAPVNSRSPEFKTVELEYGRGKWVTLELEGKSEAILWLEKNH